MDVIEIRPQAGPQEEFLSTSADIAFYGGAAGGGKTFAALMEPLRYVQSVSGFGAVIFRRETPQILAEGGPWDKAGELYRPLGAKDRLSPWLDWHFPPYDNAVKFAHMQHENDRFNWDGSQIPLIIFDQLEQFTRKQFFYMMSRNRSTCGIRPYIRGNYNPVPPDDEVGGWLHEFVGWYLDDEGYPDPERSGIIRWFVNVADKLHWFASRDAAQEIFPDIPPLSFTYIRSTVYDNQILLETDPGYLAKLFGLPLVEQERLLESNHYIREAAGKVFNRGWFEVVDALPTTGQRRDVRYWDLAATDRKRKAGAATAGVRLARIDDTIYVVDCIEEHFDPAKTDELIKNTASQDGRRVAIRWEEEGGASGKRDSQHIAKMLLGYSGEGDRPTGDKLTRSRAMAAQAKAGNVKLLRGAWNDAWINHMHAIPDGSRWDIHDASAGAFNELMKPRPRRGVLAQGRTKVKVGR